MDVLFVCLHGSAKSVVAAAHMRRLAAERGLAVECDSAAPEPDDAVPPHVVAGLVGDGIQMTHTAPKQVTAEAIRSAKRVVSFGCPLPAQPAEGRLSVWADVPAVSDGYGPARDAIVARVSALVDVLAAERNG